MWRGIKLAAITPVILCGGSGTRLWPLSRESFPKQFVPLLGGKSLLQSTLERLSTWDSVWCVANEEHRFLVKDTLDACHMKGKVLLEPAGRNTAAAMAGMTHMVDPETVLLFLPADHYIPDVLAFIKTIESGLAAAQANQIVTFGVTPTFPNPAYGYIEMGSPITQLSAFHVKQFIEKPALEKAQALLLEGNHLWNAGIFLAKSSVLQSALAEHANDISEKIAQAMLNVSMDGQFVRPDPQAFLSVRSESIDYAVMEKHAEIAVIPLMSAWSDVGSWNAVADLHAADNEGNRIEGQGLALNSRNTYIHAHSRPVVALGTEDLLIIDTPDALLVAHRNQAEAVKSVVAKLKEQNSAQATHHQRVQRPWGWYERLEQGSEFQVKRISVKPGAALSLQLHHQRAEHWVVVHGQARVTCGDRVFNMHPNESTYIPKETKHRLENIGDVHLELIEVQTGSYLGEDDIVRFEDIYGRNQS